MIFIKNDVEFYDLIKEEKVLVDFYAEWCNPCKMLDMILQDVQDIKVVKVDVDKFRSIAKEYKVLSIPSLKIFSHGEVVKEKVGFITRDELDKFLNE